MRVDTIQVGARLDYKYLTEMVGHVDTVATT